MNNERKHEHDDFFSQGEEGRIIDDSEMAASIKKRPPSRRSTVLMIAVIMLSVYFIWDIRSPLIYFFRSYTPVELGSADSPDMSRFINGQYSKISGIPDPRKAQIESLQFGVYTTHQVYFAYLGNERILCRETISDMDLLKKNVPGRESEYDSAPRTGRLFSFKDYPLKSELEVITKYLKDKFGREYPADSWVLMVGDRPWSKQQYPLALLLLLGLISLNVWQLYRRYVRKER